MTETFARPWDGILVPAPGTYHLDTAHTTIGFIARHMMVSKVRGRFTDFSGSIVVADDPMLSSAEATIRTASIDTSQEDRDNHLRSADFLDVATYPEMSFRSTRAASHVGSMFTGSGELTIKDVTREIELTLNIEGIVRGMTGEDVAGFSITAEIDREDFGMTWNRTLETGGVLVGKTIKIEIEGEAVRAGDPA